MIEILAWIWTPVLLYLVFLGLGLLADALLRSELPPALLAPVGLAVAVVVTTLGYKLRVPVVVTAVVVLAAIAGFAVGWRRRTIAWAPPALIGGALVYGLYIAPVALSGTPGWLGYNFVNDTASNFILVELLERSGAVAPAGSTGSELRAAYLVNVGYPLGSFSVVAALRPLTGVPLESAYQPFIAVFAGLAGMSLTELGRRSGLRPAAAVAAAVLAMSGVLLYRYAGHGAIKEVALVAVCATAVLLGSVALERRLAIKPVVLIAVCALAMVLVFSAAAGAFALALGLALAIAAAVSPDRPSARHVGRLLAVGAGVAVVAMVPLLGSLLDFVKNISDTFSASDGASTGEFGQLLRPLPLIQAAGVWPGNDYRIDAGGRFADVLVPAAVVVAVAGVAYCLARRRIAPLVLFVMMGLPALALAPLSSPYIDGKLLVLLTPAIVFAGAFAALDALQASRRPLRVAGGVALAVLGVGVALSGAYSFRDARVAPIDRVEAMKAVADHVPDRGLYLLNEWEEYGKVFMDDARVNPATEAESSKPISLRSDVGLEPTSPKRTPIFAAWFDLDDQTLEYVEGFRGIIMRRSPGASRPPASFKLIYRNRYYQLWHKVSGTRVVAHLPLQRLDLASRVPDCAAVRRLARRARPGMRLVASVRPRVASLSPLIVSKPDYWPVNEIPRGTVTTQGAGTLRGTLTARGPQRVWLRASALRKLDVSIDGRHVGAGQHYNTPGQWIDVGTTRLGPGAHRIEVTRNRGSWRPGDSHYGYLGPVALQALEPSRLKSVAPRDAGQLCGRPLDWIELVDGPLPPQPPIGQD